MVLTRTMFAYIWNGIVNTVFPSVCSGCRATGPYICEQCFRSVPKPASNLPEWITSLYAYKHRLIKDSIWKLKYYRGTSFADSFGAQLYDVLFIDLIAHTTKTKKPVYLVPIPVSTERRKERGYNQTELIVQAILRRDRTGMFRDGSSLLARHETQLRQSHTKSRADRLKNIQGSLYGTTVLNNLWCVVIDDVVTTGATLEQARAALEERGAHVLHAYTVAH